MSVLRMVVLSCTQAKADRTCAPWWLYKGVVWSTWRKHGPPSPPCGWQLYALSADHGLVPAYSQPIVPYDRKLTTVRVAELRQVVAEQWERMAREHARQWQADWPVEAVVVGGELYQQLAAEAGMPVAWQINGRAGADGKAGIGVLRQRLTRWAQWVYSQGDATPHAEAAWPGGGTLLEVA